MGELPPQGEENTKEEAGELNNLAVRRLWLKFTLPLPNPLAFYLRGDPLLYRQQVGRIHAGLNTRSDQEDNFQGCLEAVRPVALLRVYLGHCAGPSEKTAKTT